MVYIRVILLSIFYILYGAETKNNFYTVKWERMGITNYNYSVVNITGGCHYLNRTTKALDLNLDFSMALVEENVVYVLAHKWINNNWMKYSAIQFTETLKSILKVEWFDLQSFFLKSAKPSLSWPWRKTLYKIRNFTFNADNFPQYIPVGYYKVESTFYDTKKRENKLAQLDWYAHLIPIQKYGK